MATARWRVMRPVRTRPWSGGRQPSKTLQVKRGEVWKVDFGPEVGGEILKHRPAAIVSNDVSNRFLNRTQVVPLTSRVGRLYPSEAYVTLSGRQHKAMADQLTTVSKLRMSGLAGRLSSPDMQKVEQVIKVQLGLTP